MLDALAGWLEGERAAGPSPAAPEASNRVAPRLDAGSSLAQFLSQAESSRLLALADPASRPFSRSGTVAVPA